MKRAKIIELVLWTESRGALNTLHGVKLAAQQLVAALLEEESFPLQEATVHRKGPNKIWIASYYGLDGSQIWRSTKTSNYVQAMRLAQKWQAQVRAQRARLGLPPRKGGIRVRHGGQPSGLLTQKEVSLLLNMSERGVRAVEKRAFGKLRSHPLLRELWRRYVSGEPLEESDWTLTPEEVAALFDACKSIQELQLIEKILCLVGRSTAIHARPYET